LRIKNFHIGSARQMTESESLPIARQIYHDLCKKGTLGMVDWQVCDRYCLSAVDLRDVIAASAGHLRLRPPGIIEAVKPETAQ
jgi:hypothetical protein